jgi:hypothetical protein
MLILSAEMKEHFKNKKKPPQNILLDGLFGEDKD